MLLAFHTVMELRYGAMRAGWGQLRRRHLEQGIAELAAIQPDYEMITTRHPTGGMPTNGHPLGDKRHDGDRWIAAAAIRIGCPLVSHDSLFNDTLRLVLITALETGPH